MANQVAKNPILKKVVKAIVYDDKDAVKSFILQSQDTKDIVHHTNPPLISLAVIYDSIDICKFLFELGCDVNIKDEYGECPLHLAMRDDVSFEVAQFLLQCNADINCTNKVFESPLHTATFEGSVEKIHLLLNYEKINVNQANNSGDTALHALIYKKSFDEDEKISTIRLLLANGANKNQQNKTGETPLILAAKHLYTKVVLFLIESNCNLILKDYCGDNFLHKSNFIKDSLHQVLQTCYSSDKNILKTLLNEKNLCGYTPFKWIVSECDEKLVNECITFGADINQIDFLGQNLLHYFLKEDIFKLLISKGTNILSHDLNCQTILHKAMSLDNVKMILDNGGEALINVPDKCGFTPLHEMIETGDHNTITTLINKGADVNIIDKNGSSLVDLAIYHSNIDLVEILKSNGASAQSTKDLDTQIIDVDYIGSTCSVFPTLAKSLKDHSEFISEKCFKFLADYKVSNFSDSSKIFISDIISHETNRIILDNLLKNQSFGIVSYCDGESKLIKDTIIKTMNMVLNYIEELDERFSCTLFPTGSSSEGTRVG